MAVQAEAQVDDSAKRRVQERAISMRKLNERGLQLLRDEIIQEHGVDPDEIMAESRMPGFGWNRWKKNYRESARKIRNEKLTEAQTTGTQSQLLRYGITQLANDGWDLMPSVFESDIAEVVPSKGFENYYAPLYRPGRGGPIARGQSFPEIKISGLDVTIRNYPFGAMASIEKYALDDDQTGQLAKQGAAIGESLSYEVDIFGFQGMVKATWPVQVATPGAITTPLVSEARRRLKKSYDKNGGLLNTRPDTILTDTDEETETEQIIHSFVAANNPGSTPAAGSVPYFGVINPFRNQFKIVCTPYLSQAVKELPTTDAAYNANGYGLDGATPPKWLMRAKVGIILQLRDPLEVEQEAPNSGQAFEANMLRWRATMRFGSDVVEPRYGCRLN